MLTRLLQQTGGEGAELCRRWVAALLLAPESERRSIVEAVEQRIVETYGETPPRHPAEDAERLIHLVAPPTQHADHTEVVVRSYSVAEPRRKKATKTARRGG